MNKRPRLQIFAAMVLCLQVFSAHGADLTIIDLQHRSAAEVLPVLRPLVGADVALSGTDYKLIVRGSAVEVARIREALAVVDRAPKQLRVSVRYTGSPTNSTSEFAAGTDNKRQLVVRGEVSASTATDSNVSSVRVIEGNGAHIATGQSVPLVTAYMRSSRNRPAVSLTTDYREFISGFDVVPRINGERVLLEISTQQQRPADLGSSSATAQYTTTTLAGRIGEWIELGGVASSISQQDTNAGASGGARQITTQSDQRTVMVKVEQVD